MRAEGLPSGSALAARGSVDEGLYFGVMGSRSWRSNDGGAEDGVEMIGEMVTAWVDVD